MSNKATQEVAKAAHKSLEVAEKAGSWADTVFGDGFRHLGQAFADSMAGFRVRNRIKVLEKTRRAIEDSGLTGTTRPLPERIAVPLLEAIGDESDETLQDVWAAYIRDAVDPARPKPDRLLIDVIRRLEPSDWPILQRLLAAETYSYGPEALGVDADALTETMDRLSIIGLFDYDDPKSAFIVTDGHYAGAVQVKSSGATYYENKLFRKLAASINSISPST